MCPYKHISIKKEMKEAAERDISRRETAEQTEDVVYEKGRKYKRDGIRWCQ